VYLLALEQELEPVDAQPGRVPLNRVGLTAGARDRVERAGVPGRLDRDATSTAGRRSDREADRLLGAVCDQHLFRGGRRPTTRQLLGDQCPKLRPAERHVAVAGGAPLQICRRR
jgi:hypothetical protein